MAKSIGGFTIFFGRRILFNEDIDTMRVERLRGWEQAVELLSHPLRTLKTMSATMTLTTADEYLAQGETEERMELIEGEIVIMNTPKFVHQVVASHILVELTLWIRGGVGRGVAAIELDHRLNDRNVFAPDVWWMNESKRPARDAAYTSGPPDLAVEVRSESTWRYDIGTKKRVYEDNGLPELWLVDTSDESVVVFRRSTSHGPIFDIALEFRRGDNITSPLLDGFSLDVAILFDA
jgi:Uma2 family endonuclease